MRRMYMVDLGLLVAAGALAFVLTTKPASSEPNGVQEDAVAIVISEASAVVSSAQELFAEWFLNEEGEPGS